MVLDDATGSLIGFIAFTFGIGFSSTAGMATFTGSGLAGKGLDAVFCLDGDFLGLPGDLDLPRLLDLEGTFLPGDRPGDRDRPRLDGD